MGAHRGNTHARVFWDPQRWLVGDAGCYVVYTAHTEGNDAFTRLRPAQIHAEQRLQTLWDALKDLYT